jgi:hypothetical protein
MAQPTFRRFWVRILPDGSAIPQFDPRTGKYCGYEAYPGSVAQILFYPITPRLAELIKKQGDIAQASGLRPLAFDVLPGSMAPMHRVGKLRLEPKRICGFCEAEFDAALRVCPRCLAKNQWYCGKCDELKETPIIDFELQNSDGDERIIRIPPALWEYAPDIVRQIGEWGIKGTRERCPDCEATDPRGVRTIRCLGDFCEEKLFTHYILVIDDEKHIIMDYRRIDK